MSSGMKRRTKTVMPRKQPTPEEIVQKKQDRWVLARFSAK